MDENIKRKVTFEVQEDVKRNSVPLRLSTAQMKGKLLKYQLISEQI